MKYCPECAGSFADEMVHGKLRPVCKLCGFVFYQGPKLAAGLLVVDQGKVLLHRRDVGPREGTWTFPSGYVELGESPAEAAIREAQEETDLAAAVDQLLGVYTNQSHSVSLIMYAGHLEESASIDQDSDRVGLFPLDNLPEMSFEHDLQILEDWRRHRATGKAAS